MDWWRSFFICSMSIKQHVTGLLNVNYSMMNTQKNTIKNTLSFITIPVNCYRSKVNISLFIAILVQHVFVQPHSSWRFLWNKLLWKRSPASCMIDSWKLLIDLTVLGFWFLYGTFISPWLSLALSLPLYLSLSICLPPPPHMSLQPAKPETCCLRCWSSTLPSGYQWTRPCSTPTSTYGTTQLRWRRWVGFQRTLWCLIDL